MLHHTFSRAFRFGHDPGSPSLKGLTLDATRGMPNFSRASGLCNTSGLATSGGLFCLAIQKW
jgi:hypothetical protein